MIQQEKMHQYDIDELVNILAIQADSSQDSHNFFDEIIKSANLPSKWVLDIKVDGSPNQFSRKLINWAWNKGINSNDPNFHTLGSILHVLLDRVGPDISLKIAILIVGYELYRDKTLLKELKEKQYYLKELNTKGFTQGFDSLFEAPYLTYLNNNSPDSMYEDLKQALQESRAEIQSLKKEIQSLQTQLASKVDSSKFQDMERQLNSAIAVSGKETSKIDIISLVPVICAGKEHPTSAEDYYAPSDKIIEHNLYLDALLPSNARIISAWYEPYHNISHLTKFALIRLDKYEDQTRRIKLSLQAYSPDEGVRLRLNVRVLFVVDSVSL